MPIAPRDIVYRASPTLGRFHRSKAMYRGVCGPVGSGKSTACCWEMWARMHGQAPDAARRRRTRWAVIRNTYGELRDTTVKTWLEWFPESIVGEFRRQDMTHVVKYKDVEAEILFRALDRPDDIKKILSLELTGAWINEAREVPKGIIDALSDRVGRYPAQRDGGCTWAGVIMDTNPPDDDHWWYRLAEEERPKGWQFFRQPGGVLEHNGSFIPNPKAENIEHLEPDYYMKRVPGKSLDHVRVYYAGQYGFVRDGKAVHSDYVDAVHCSKELLQPIPGVPIIVGLDFGLTPAAVFAQRLPSGAWIWFDELVTDDMDTTRFAELLGPKMRSEYQGWKFQVYGDPAGDQRASTDSSTPYQILAKAGIAAQPAGANNDPEIRRGSLGVALRRMVDGKPGFRISPKCRITRKGLAGGYCYKRMRVAGEDRFQDVPDKNRYSHPVEAGEYAMVGGGEGKALVAIDRPAYRRPPRVANAGARSWMGV